MKKHNFDLRSIRKSRHKRIFKRIKENSERLRLRVVKTNLHFYLNVIDDEEQKTVISSSSLQMKLKNGNTDNALLVAKNLLKKLEEKKIDSLALDRGPRNYHGKIAITANYLRENGIKI